MLSWSDRHASMATVSSRLGALTVERDFVPNMREMGDLNGLAYPRPFTHQRSHWRKKEQTNKSRSHQCTTTHTLTINQPSLLTS